MKTFLSIALAATLVAQTDPAEKIRLLVETLRSESATEREQATLTLRTMGPAAIPALEKAAEDKDSEVSNRARQILRVLEAGVAQGELLKIEQTLKNAKTLRLKYAFEGTTGGDHPGKLQGSGSLALKDGNKLSYSESLSGWGEKQEYVLRSDGSTFLWQSKKPEYGTTPPTLRDDVDTRLARFGASMLLTVLGYAVDAPEATYRDQVARLRLPLQFEKVRGDNPKELSYRRIEENDRSTHTTEVTVWYDPKTYLPIKRRVYKKSVVISGGIGGEQDYTETSLWALGEDIPDETFAVPKKK